jgi:hypothetical protein
MAVARPAGRVRRAGDQMSLASSETPRQLPTSLPAGWEQAWDAQDSHVAVRLNDLRRAIENLALDVPTYDRRNSLSDLVSAGDLTSAPIHRWYSYKEGFSPRLPHLVLELLPDVPRRVVADAFGGVATTPLTLQFAEGVEKVVGIEYSPFAHFVGETKLGWAELEPVRLRRNALRLARFPLSKAALPKLTSFHDERIFPPSVAQSLVSVRHAIQSDRRLTDAERKFLLLGLASIVEDVSGIAKDGRALRVINGRRRIPKALRPQREAVAGTEVAAILLNQWRAMIEDLDAMAPLRELVSTTAHHYRGDARDLSSVRLGGELALSPASIDCFIYSPPYLNCIDYTEVYKLELWLLEFVTDQEAFRKLRLGTLRSHPSVEFPATLRFQDFDAPVTQTIEALASFVEEQHARPNMGRMIRNYFEDMFAAFREQQRFLAPGGAIACVVANSTFSRRDKVEGSWHELWRLPVPSDLILAGLAELAGFTDVQIWDARALRPRNVRNGAARESILVARKPTIEKSRR